MIVADTNLVAYLLLGGQGTEHARQVFLRDPDWAAPFLWRSEMRSVLARYLRTGELSLSDARLAQARAEALFRGREFLVDSGTVLGLVAKSNCSAYDCEFVALAQELHVPLITSDRHILAAFPATARNPAVFGATPPSSSRS